MDKIDLEMNEIAEKLEKAMGEGSRGGKIIGHTRSGKPIYDDHGHAAHADFSWSDHQDAIKAHHSHITDTKIGRYGTGNLHLMHEADDSSKLTPKKREKIKASRESLTSHVHSLHQKKIADAKAKGDADLEHSYKEDYNKFKDSAHKTAAMEGMSKKDKGKHEELLAARKEAASKRSDAAASHGYNSPEHKEASRAHEESHAAVLSHEEEIAAKHPRAPEHEPIPLDQEKVAKEKDDLDKFTERQANKPKIKGVHTAVMPSDPGTSNAGAHVPGSGYGSNVETAKRLHREKLEEMKNMPKPQLEKSHESILNTIITMGPEALRKALPTLSEEQKLLLKEVLEKAKASMPMDTGPEDGQELLEIASKKAKNTKERAGEADEHMIKPAADEIAHQGDKAQLDGQLIKAKEKGGVPNDEKDEQKEINAMESGRAEKEEEESAPEVKPMMQKPAPKMEAAEKPQGFAPKMGDQSMKPQMAEPQVEEQPVEAEQKPSPEDVVARMQQRGMKKSECLAAAEAKGETELVKAIKKMWKPEESPIEKEAESEGESEEQESNEKASGKEKMMEAKAKKMKKEDAKDVPMAMEKSIPWTEGTARLLKASTRRGQNAHYTVEETLLKADAEEKEILAKGGYLNEMSGEQLAKSEGAPAPQFRKSYSEEMILKGLDMKSEEYRRLTQNAKPQTLGKFQPQSFTVEELAKSMGISAEKAAEILGDSKPQEKK